VTVLARDAASGALASIGCVSDNGTDGLCAKGAALRGATALALSADGAHAYVASRSSGSIGVFARDPVTGALRQIGCLLRGAPPGVCARADYLAGVSALALSRDGSTLWAASSSGLTALARGADGGLSGVGCLGPDGCPSATLFRRPTSLLAATDGTRVLVAESTTGTVAVVARGPAGLTEAGCLRGRESYGPGVCTRRSGMDRPAYMAVSADGRVLYTAANDGVVALSLGAPW
jgi:DNA-binding beta-propeller fold protein YncE